MEVLRCPRWSMLCNTSIFASTINSISTSRGKGRARCRTMSTLTNTISGKWPYASLTVPPPAHPTYDLKAIIKLALAEDLGDKGDVSCLATIPIEREAEAHFLAKEDGVLAGIAMADIVFEEVDPLLKVEWSQKDGSQVKRGLQFGSVHGSARSILAAERVVLNFMQRMSGIATLTKAMAEAARPARILETRKTAPALRLVDKWAVQIGGGENHRMGLFDMVMLKDNHISIAGGVSNAIASVEQYLKQNNLQMAVEVETRTLEEVKEVMSYTAQGRSVVTRIMLDNMIAPLPNGDVDVSMLKEAVQLINGRFETEASGNVTIDTVGKIGTTGVTFISSCSMRSWVIGAHAADSLHCKSLGSLSKLSAWQPEYILDCIHRNTFQDLFQKQMSGEVLSHHTGCRQWGLDSFCESLGHLP